MDIHSFSGDFFSYNAENEIFPKNQCKTDTNKASKKSTHGKKLLHLLSVTRKKYAVELRKHSLNPVGTNHLLILI